MIFAIIDSSIVEKKKILNKQFNKALENIEFVLFKSEPIYKCKKIIDDETLNIIFRLIRSKFISNLEFKSVNEIKLIICEIIEDFFRKWINRDVSNFDHCFLWYGERNKFWSDFKKSFYITESRSYCFSNRILSIKMILHNKKCNI